MLIYTTCGAFELSAVRKCPVTEIPGHLLLAATDPERRQVLEAAFVKLGDYTQIRSRRRAYLVALLKRLPRLRGPSTLRPNPVPIFDAPAGDWPLNSSRFRVFVRTRDVGVGLHEIAVCLGSRSVTYEALQACALPKGELDLYVDHLLRVREMQASLGLFNLQEKP